MEEFNLTLWLKELNYVLHLGCLGVLVDVDVDVVCFFFSFAIHFWESKIQLLKNHWMVTEMETAFKTFKQASTKKKLSFKYTLRHFHEVHQMCEQFTFKTFNNECKTKLKIFLFQYREYLDLKQHVDQLRNKQKHLRSQRDVSNIQSL